MKNVKHSFVIDACIICLQFAYLGYLTVNIIKEKCELYFWLDCDYIYLLFCDVFMLYYFTYDLMI